MDNTQVATKDDVSLLRTELKLEIKAVKTELKTDIKAVRTELKAEIKFLRQDMLKLEARVENLEEGQKQMNVKLDKILLMLDGFVGVVDNLRADNTVGTHHIHELQMKVADQEKKLQQIASSKHAV